MTRTSTGYWNKKKAKFKQLFPDLIDGDLLLIQGEENEMMNSLSNKLGKSRQEILSIIIGI